MKQPDEDNDKPSTDEQLLVRRSPDHCGNMNHTDENISRNHRKEEPHLVFQPEMNGDQPMQWKDLARTRVEFNSVQPIFRDTYPGLA